jgi:hypothetical protein
LGFPFSAPVIPWILSLNALNHVTAFTMNLALNLEPVYGILLAIFFVKEYNMLTSGILYWRFYHSDNGYPSHVLPLPQIYSAT